MAHSIEIGATRADSQAVGDEHAITFLGPAGPRVLSTPRMILFMERACREDIFVPQADGVARHGFKVRTDLVGIGG